AGVPIFKSRPSRRKSLQERLARAEAGRIYIAARHGDHRSNPDRPVFHGYNQHQAVCGGDAGGGATSPTAAGDWRDDSGRGRTPQVYQQRQTACANRDSQAHRRNQRSATGAGKRRWCRGWRPGRRAGRPDGWSDWRCAWWSIEHGSQAGGGAPTSKIRSDPSWWPCECPRAIFQVPPAYPPLARQARIEGQVQIDAVLDENGSVVEMKVVSGPALLYQAALEALKKWKYEPTYLNDQPIAVQLIVTVTFVLSQ